MWMTNNLKITIAKNILKFSVFLNIVVGFVIGVLLTTVGHNNAQSIDWFWGIIIGSVLSVLFGAIPWGLYILFPKQGSTAQAFFWVCLILYLAGTFPLGLILGIFIIIGKIAFDKESIIRT